MSLPLRALALALAVLLLAAGTPAAAQDAFSRDLAEKVERMRNELSTLQRAVYQGDQVSESQSAQNTMPSNQGAQFHVRLTELEGELRNLTGRIEQLSYKMDRLSTRLDQLVTDVDGRLQRLEAGGATASGEPAAEGRTASEGQQALAGAEEAGEPAQSDTGEILDPPKTLGVISKQDLESEESASSTRSQQTARASNEARLPDAAPEEQYEAAFSRLQQGDFDEAEGMLRDFAERHPDHERAGNALYWLGETYYVRENYKDAAVSFAEAYQKYPESSKAPDNLLKLGMALAALDRTDDACNTQSALQKRYSDANPTILERSRREMERLQCQ